MNDSIKKYFSKTFGVAITLFLFAGFFSVGNVALAADFKPSCPFSPQSGRIIVHFEDESLGNGILSDRGISRAYESKSVSIPAGTYNVSLQSFDGGSSAERSSQAQKNEKYYLQLRNGGTVVAQTGSTNDLSDSVSNPVWSGRVSSNLVLSQNINTVVAAHSAYPDTSSPNSVNVGCAAFDSISTPPPSSGLSVSCSVNPSSANTGDLVSWNATASGGNGSFNYSWSGTDGLFGNYSFVSKSYFSSGTKTGTVTVTSGSQSASKTCSMVVGQNTNNNLSVSCSADKSNIDIDEDVTWRAYASGGDGDYDYDWDGTDDLNGSSRNLTWSYDDDGTKRATVTVTSDGESESASCTVRVRDEDSDDDDLSVACYASPSNPQIGSRMNWYVRVSGGDGDYDYDWEGTDGLNSSNRSPYMTYYNPGRKTATVTVRDGDGNRDSDTCYATVNSVLAYSQSYQPPMASAVYLSQVPYTGLEDNFKVSLFVIMLGLFSAWLAYAVTSYQKNNG